MSLTNQISEKDDEINNLELLHTQATEEIETLQNELELKDNLILSLEELTPISEKEGWVEVKRVSGSSTRNTEPFYIDSDTWRITYTYTAGSVGDTTVLNIIAVKVSNGVPMAQIVSQNTNKVESSYVYFGNDDFYLGVSGYNVNYEIIIEEFHDV